MNEGNTLEERRALRLAKDHRPWGCPEDFVIKLDTNSVGAIEMPRRAGGREAHGSPEFPLTERIASDISAHGLTFARTYQLSRGVTLAEWRVLYAGAQRVLAKQQVALMLRRIIL
jgi:hypothetical protein